MKKLFLLTVLNFILLGVHAQSISNKVVATTGSSFANANFSVSQTVGEVSINSLTAGGVTMNQGFHQPTVNNNQCNFSLNGGADSIIVCGTSTTINATSGFTTYLWSNGLTTSSITANTSGWYKCTVTQGTCTAIDSVYLRISNVVPATPTAITITALQTNVCGARKYRYSVPVSTAASLTGYLWSFQGPLNSSMTIDSGSLNSRVLTVTYTSNVVASLSDSVKCRYTSICGNSLTKAAKLTNTALNIPVAPTSITVTALQTNVCGARRYRYTAPVLPAATTTSGAATGYVWDFIGALSATVDSGSLTSRVFTATFSSNAASAIGDSVRVYYTSACGNSLRKALKLTNTLLSAPLTPATITITALQTNVCGARRYRYTAPVLPAATTTAGVATGYVWDFIGALSATIDSGSLTSRVFTATFSSNAASAIGDSVRVYYTSACGNSLRKASKLTNALLGAPLAPASITIQLKSDVCYARTYRYIAPVLPVATTTAGAATGYIWSTPFGALGSTGVIDSGNVNSKIITVTYSSNAAAAAGDSIKLRYSSGCGNGALKAQKLSNILKACPPLPGFSKTGPKSTTPTTSDLGKQIFPNPNKGIFTIKINTGILAIAKALIEIRDIQGRLVHTINTQNVNGVINERVQKNELTSGVYLVTYRLGEVRKSMKMVVE